MPFGLCKYLNFSWNSFLEGCAGKVVWCISTMLYIVYGKTFDETLHRLTTVWDRLRADGLTMKAKKCMLFHAEVSYLGHPVSRQGLLQIIIMYLQTVRYWPRPTTVKRFVEC